MKNTLRRTTPLAVVLTGAFALVGCQRDEAHSDLGQLKMNVQYYGGMTVTVDGEVDEVYGPHVFKIENDELYEDELWVVSPRGVSNLTAGEEVRISGEMREFVVADLEREYNLVWPDELEIEARDTVVMIANSVSDEM